MPGRRGASTEAFAVRSRGMTSAMAAVEARLLDDPDDEQAWQAYAPLLHAAGDPRGALLSLATHADTPERRATLAAWEAEYGGWTPVAAAPSSCERRHGFVVGCTVRILDRSDVRWLGWTLAHANARLIGRLDLEIDARVPSRSLAGLEAAALGRLRVLRSVHHARGNRVARALAEQATLGLRTLDLRYSGLTDDGLLALAGCPQLRGLRELHLQHNRFTEIGVEALAGSPALAEVAVLDLRHNRVGPAGAAALAASAHVGGLATLHLHAAQAGAEGARALGASTTLRRDLARWWRAIGEARP